MNLLKMRTQVRYAINGVDDDFWSDGEIDDYLNEGARLLVAEAQPLQSLHQITLIANQQEYVLPVDFDEAYSVSYQNGNSVYELKPSTSRSSQIGTATTSSMPVFYYIRHTVSSKYDQNTTTNNITESSLGLSDNSNRAVLGLNPIPSEANTVNVFYFPKHYEMKNDGDVSPIDPTYHRGIIAYAAAMCKQKDDALGEMQFHLKIFKEFKDRLRAKTINRGLTEFSKVRIVDEEAIKEGSSVIFLDNQASYGS